MSTTGFDYSEGRTTRRVVAPPGGTSSIVFGNAPAPTPVTPAPAPVAENPTADGTPEKPAEPSPAPEQTEQAPFSWTLDSLKLQAIKSTVDADSVASLVSVLSDLLKSAESGTAPISRALTPTPVKAAGTTAPAEGMDTLEALVKLKAKLKARGTHGIISLGIKFRSMDDDNDRKISFVEFKKAMVELDMKESEIHQLFRYLDSDCSGYLSFDELLVGLRGTLNERRQEIVNKAFKVFDKDGDGVVTMNDLEGRYDASHHPDVVSGAKTSQQVLSEFMQNFEGEGEGKGDGKITLQEFSKYYGMVSASIDDDDYFELVIRNVWHISGGEGWCENTTCRRLLVLHEDGTQTVEEIKDDFDIASTDLEAMKKNLLARGIPAKKVALYGGFSDLDPATAPPPPKAAGAGTGSPARPASARKADANRSSIIFG